MGKGVTVGDRAAVVPLNSDGPLVLIFFLAFLIADTARRKVYQVKCYCFSQVFNVCHLS